MAAISDGKIVEKKKLRRSPLVSFFSKKQLSNIAMEACSGSHHWARIFKQQGHSLQLLPAQHVKAYLRSQKNDYNDAAAIAAACSHKAIKGRSHQNARTAR